jgi:hypothetical protein
MNMFVGERVNTGWKPVLPGPAGPCPLPHTPKPVSQTSRLWVTGKMPVAPEPGGRLALEPL